jgi:hypothetical protein
MAVRLRLDSPLIQAEQLLIYRVLLRDQPAIADLVQSVLGQLVLQPHFVVFGLSSLVVAGAGAVLVAAAPAGPGPGECPVGQGVGQVCQQTADFAEGERNEAVARSFGVIAAVTAR